MENENKKVIEYGTKIYLFCKERWNFYEKQDGAYLPSRHDKKVFKDASKEFGISEKECERWFDFIDKPIAEKLVQEAIKEGKFVELCDEVLGGNGENPWGFQKILKQIHSIFSEIGEKGLKRTCITVAKSDRYDVDYTEIVSGEKYNKQLNMLITNVKISTSKNVLCKGGKNSNKNINTIIDYLQKKLKHGIGKQREILIVVYSDLIKRFMKEFNNIAYFGNLKGFNDYKDFYKIRYCLRSTMTETYQSVISGETVTGILNCANATLQFVNGLGLVESSLKGIIAIKIVKAVTMMSASLKTLFMITMRLPLIIISLIPQGLFLTLLTV